MIPKLTSKQITELSDVFAPRPMEAEGCPHCADLMQTITELREELRCALAFQAIYNPPTPEQLENLKKRGSLFSLQANE